MIDDITRIAAAAPALIAGANSVDELRAVEADLLAVDASPHLHAPGATADFDRQDHARNPSARACAVQADAAWAG